MAWRGCGRARPGPNTPPPGRLRRYLVYHNYDISDGIMNKSRMILTTPCPYFIIYIYILYIYIIYIYIK